MLESSSRNGESLIEGASASLEIREKSDKWLEAITRRPKRTARWVRSSVDCVSAALAEKLALCDCVRAQLRPLSPTKARIHHERRRCFPVVKLWLSSRSALAIGRR